MAYLLRESRCKNSVLALGLRTQAGDIVFICGRITQSLEPHRWKQTCLQQRYSLLRAAVERNRITEPSNTPQHPACSLAAALSDTRTGPQII